MAGLRLNAVGGLRVDGIEDWCDTMRMASVPGGAGSWDGCCGIHFCTSRFKRAGKFLPVMIDYGADEDLALLISDSAGIFQYIACKRDAMYCLASATHLSQMTIT